MAADSEPQHQLGVGARLAEPPSPTLVRSAFQSELQHAAFLYEGLSYADVAHALMLIEAAIIPADAGTALLNALVDLHEAGLDALPLEAKWGDLYNNRDAELQRRLGRVAGWLHAGRARREALTLGWLMHLRHATRALVRATAHLLQTIAAVAERHVASLMPDFTYLQHAHPTTLGHFLLGFAYPALRDAERLQHELRYVNCSPAGSASTNGSRLPLNRERLRELLGFEQVTVHNRDAMWQSDVPINLTGIVVSLATTADRLAEELQIWATAEFDFVELADRHCRTSVIMPNKKNPYALTHIRGRARDLDGKLVSVITTNQTPSGQIDNRNTAYALVPEALETAHGLITLLSEVLAHATFNTERMRRQADSGFTFGTELTDVLMQREGIDSRAAHEIVGTVVAAQLRDGSSPATLAADLARAFSAAVGRPLATAASALIPELTAERIVQGRVGLGGCAPESVRQMASAVRERSRHIVSEIEQAAAASTFPALLRRCVSERIKRTW